MAAKERLFFAREYYINISISKIVFRQGLA
jgi:hypothetical protein